MSLKRAVCEFAHIQLEHTALSILILMVALHLSLQQTQSNRAEGDEGTPTAVGGTISSGFSRHRAIDQPCPLRLPTINRMSRDDCVPLPTTFRLKTGRKRPPITKSACSSSVFHAECLARLCLSPNADQFSAKGWSVLCLLFGVGAQGVDWA